MASDTGHFQVGFSAGERRTFQWLALGHLLFAGGLFGAFMVELRIDHVWVLTPLFVLPLLAMGPKDRIGARAGVLLFGFTAIHFLATRLAITSVDLGAMLTPGAVGGLVGGAGSLALCSLAHLTRRDHAGTVAAIVGIVLLTVVGALGLNQILSASGDTGGSVLSWLWLYTPWQIAFAWVLAKLLR